MSSSGWLCVECWKLDESKLHKFNRRERADVIKEIAVRTGPQGFAPGQLGEPIPITTEHTIGTIICFFIVFGAFFYIPIVIGLALLWGSWTQVVMVLGFVGFLAFGPAPYVPSINHSWISKCMTYYCSYRFVMDADLETYLKCPSLFGLVAPHGVFPLQNILCHFHVPKVMGMYVRGLAADAVLRMPIVRQFLCAMGAISASKKVAFDHMAKGFLCGVSPDGIAGIFEVNDPSGDEVLVILNRKGIYEISLVSGTPIICTYTFGTTAAFDAWYDQKGSLQRISRLIRTSLFLFWGRCYLPIPYRVAITTVVGRPVMIEKVSNPTPEQIDALRERVLAEFQRIFETHKHAYGWGKKKLVFK
eukprot:c4082_g1_i1.p1 GENE.c4082_g1_i1~~c4082_g1_i1.p1  ORF type:complete len:360 (+),score=62.45 c4082_g1_i1:36-1115(+)